jgi:glycosyltransferase 2 family protein
MHLSKNNKFYIFIVSIFFFFIAIRDFNLTNFTNTIVGVKIEFIFLAVISQIIGSYIRSTRWNVFFFQTKNYKFNSSVGKYYYFIGNSLNNIIPFRFGDLYRVLSFSIETGTKKSKTLFLILYERVWDLLIAMLFFLISLNYYKSHVLNFFQSDLLIIAIYTIFIFLTLILFLPKFLLNACVLLSFKINFLQKPLLRFFLSLKDQLTPRKSFDLLVRTIIGWTFEILYYFFILLAMSIRLDIVGVFLIFSVTTLSTLIPSSPGFVGTFHFFNKSTLVLLGINPTLAISSSIISHLILWVNITVCGLVLFLFKNFSNCFFTNKR